MHKKKIKIVLFTYMYSVVFACIHLFLMCSLYLICVRYKFSHFQDFFIFKNDKNSFYIKIIRVCFIFCMCSVCVRDVFVVFLLYLLCSLCSICRNDRHNKLSTFLNTAIINFGIVHSADYESISY